MLPTAVLLLLHVPPEVTSESVVVDPTQTEVVPVIVAGKGLTETVVKAPLIDVNGGPHGEDPVVQDSWQ